MKSATTSVELRPGWWLSPEWWLFAPAWYRPGRDCWIRMEVEGGDTFYALDIEWRRWRAFLAPAFPANDRLADLDPHELAQLVAIFDPAPDDWFAARVRGVVIDTADAILRGRLRDRDINALLESLATNPERFRGNRLTERWLRLQFTGTDVATMATSSRQLFSEARAAFPIPRGAPADENRAAFLEEIVRIAVDNGMEPSLPQHRDSKDSTTPFFTFARAMRDIVVNRVYRAGRPSPQIKKRLTPFECGRVALLGALGDARKKVKGSP